MNKLKAMMTKGTTLTKLAVLKSEYEKGSATEADLVFWDKYLDQLHQQGEHFMDAKEAETRYRFHRAMLSSQVYRKSLAKKSVACMVFSSLNGVFEEFEEKTAELKQERDVVVILGNFLDPDAKGNSFELIRKMMKLQMEESVIILKGEHEENYLLNTNLDDVSKYEEVQFLNQLPKEFRTEDFSMMNGNLNLDDFPLKEILDGEAQNMSDKMLVYVNKEVSKEVFQVNNDERIIALSDHVAMRLDFNA